MFTSWNCSQAQRSHKREISCSQGAVPTLSVCALSLKRSTFGKTCWDRSKCKCLGKQTRTLRLNGTAKRDWYVANLLYVSCGLNPSTSLHTVCNLCLRSSVKSWIEMEVPCRTACTNESRRRNSWKASRTCRRGHVNVCLDPLLAPCLTSHWLL